MIRPTQHDAYSGQSWGRKFQVATRGVLLGFRTQSSFRVHLPIALAVTVVAGGLGVEIWQWCVLIGCIGGVLALELINTSLESLSRAVTREENPWVRDALDLGSGAVLLGSVAASLIGLLALLPNLLSLWES